MSDIPKELVSALRQYRSNREDDFVFGFDQETTIAAFELLKDEIRRILVLTKASRKYTHRELILVLDEINSLCKRALPEDCG